MKSFRSLMGATLPVTASVSAHAYTECPGKVTRVFTDFTVEVSFDTGFVWPKTAQFGPAPGTPTAQPKAKQPQRTFWPSQQRPWRPVDH